MNIPEKIHISQIKQMLLHVVAKIIQNAYVAISIRECDHTPRIDIRFLCKEKDWVIGIDCEHPRTKEEVASIINQFKKTYERFMLTGYMGCAVDVLKFIK